MGRDWRGGKEVKRHREKRGVEERRQRLETDKKRQRQIAVQVHLELTTSPC